MLEVHRYDYRLMDQKWADDTITWSFADLIIPGDPRQNEIGTTFSRDDSDGMRSLVRDAFDAWESVCGIDFVEVSDSRSSDIRIGWTSRGYSDGPGGTLAYYQAWTWSGTTTTSQALIAVDWDDSGVPLDDLYDTLVHEVDHAVGLAHSDVSNVVMSGGLYSGGGPTPYWGGVPGRDPLQPDDIQGAIALWGPSSGDGGGTMATRTGTNGGDTLIGTQSADYIDGRGGNDSIYGLRGNDTLLGGAGNDTISGGVNLDGHGAHESTGGAECPGRGHGE